MINCVSSITFSFPITKSYLPAKKSTTLLETILKIVKYIGFIFISPILLVADLSSSFFCNRQDFPRGDLAQNRLKSQNFFPPQQTKDIPLPSEPLPKTALTQQINCSTGITNGPLSLSSSSPSQARAPNYTSFEKGETQSRLRNRYESFDSYIQARNACNGPVDLIIGRGTLINASDPVLQTTRFDQSGKWQTKPSYQPYTIDIDRQREPDLQLDVMQLRKHLPPESVDEIYCERLFPSIYRNLQFYYEIAGVLKIGGVLIIDYNDGPIPKEAGETIAKLIQSKFNELEIPFWIDHYEPKSDLDQKKFIRNDLKEFPKLVCQKYGESSELEKKKLCLLTRKNHELNEQIKNAKALSVKF